MSKWENNCLAGLFLTISGGLKTKRISGSLSGMFLVSHLPTCFHIRVYHLHTLGQALFL